MGSQTQCLLRKFGAKKIYDAKRETASGDKFSFDGCFMKALDNYLESIPFPMTKSQYNNIKIFIEFANGKLPTNSIEYQSMLEFDKHLATIGV